MTDEDTYEEKLLPNESMNKIINIWCPHSAVAVIGAKSFDSCNEIS